MWNSRSRKVADVDSSLELPRTERVSHLMWQRLVHRMNHKLCLDLKLRWTCILTFSGLKYQSNGWRGRLFQLVNGLLILWYAANMIRTLGFLAVGDEDSLMLGNTVIHFDENFKLAGTNFGLVFAIVIVFRVHNMLNGGKAGRVMLHLLTEVCEDKDFVSQSVKRRTGHYIQMLAGVAAVAHFATGSAIVGYMFTVNVKLSDQSQHAITGWTAWWLVDTATILLQAIDVWIFSGMWFTQVMLYRLHVLKLAQSVKHAVIVAIESSEEQVVRPRTRGPSPEKLVTEFAAEYEEVNKKGAAINSWSSAMIQVLFASVQLLLASAVYMISFSSQYKTSVTFASGLCGAAVGFSLILIAGANLIALNHRLYTALASFAARTASTPVLRMDQRTYVLKMLEDIGSETPRQVLYSWDGHCLTFVSIVFAYYTGTAATFMLMVTILRFQSRDPTTSFFS